MDRCLLYSLTHGGYVNFLSIESRFDAPLSEAEQFEADMARALVNDFPAQDLKFADLDGWISGEDALPPEGLAIERHGYRPDEPGAWRPAQERRPMTQAEAEASNLDVCSEPAQEERDAPPPCSVCGRPTGGCCTVADHSTEHSVTSPPLPSVVAGPVTPNACHCIRCGGGQIDNGTPLPSTVMVLCPTCGNKRCPHATDHRLACTGSNEPGQWGSDYGTPVEARSVTPDAAGVGGVRERLEALRDDLRREADRDFTDPCARGGATMAGSVVADLDAILAALPEGELIDAGKWEFAHDDFGQLYACPVDGVEPQGVRVFVQRKEVG